MQTAECQNCEHHWKLTKPLGEYANGGPSCPDCGSTNVDVAERQPEDASQTPSDSQQPANTQQATTAADSLVEVGMQGGDALTKLRSDDPVEAAEGIESLAQLAAGGLVQAAQRHAQSARNQTQAAKDAANDDIAKATDYPDCPECGKALQQIPPEAGSEFTCPHCGEILHRN